MKAATNDIIPIIKYCTLARGNSGYRLMLKIRRLDHPRNQFVRELGIPEESLFQRIEALVEKMRRIRIPGRLSSVDGDTGG